MWTLTGKAEQRFLCRILNWQQQRSDNGNDGDINSTGGKSWGLYANTSQSANAVRPLNAPLYPGSVFTIFMDNGNVDTNSTVGFGLQNSVGTPWLRPFRGGNSNYSVKGDTEINSGVAFTREGLRIVVTITAPSSYQAAICRALGKRSHDGLGKSGECESWTGH